MMKSWYEDKQLWAKAEPLIFNRNSFYAAEEEIPQLEKITQLKPGDKILDLCCGPGRHSIPLAEKGYQVTAVDLTKAYLNSLVEKAKEKKLDIEIIHANMLNYRQENTFELVINMFTSFGYLDSVAENMTVLQNIYDSLKTGGSFLLQTVSKEYFQNKEDTLKTSCKEEQFHFEETTRITCAGEKAHNIWKLDFQGRKSEIEFEHFIYSGLELEESLLSIGFKEIIFYEEGMKSHIKNPELITLRAIK